MDITEKAAWTISKDGQQIELAIDDLQQLLHRLVWVGDLMVTDDTSGRIASGSEEIGVSVIDESIQIRVRSGEV